MRPPGGCARGKRWDDLRVRPVSVAFAALCGWGFRLELCDRVRFGASPNGGYEPRDAWPPSTRAGNYAEYQADRFSAGQQKRDGSVAVLGITRDSA